MAETDIDKKIGRKHDGKKEHHAKYETKIEEKPPSEETPPTEEPIEVKEEAPPSGSKKKIFVWALIIVLIAIGVAVYYYWPTLMAGQTQQLIVRETKPVVEVTPSPQIEEVEEKVPVVEEKAEEVKEEVVAPQNETVVEVPTETEGEVALAEYFLKEGEKISRQGNFVKARSSTVITLGRASLISTTGSGYKVVLDKFSTGKPQKVNRVYLMEKEPINTQDIIRYGIDLGELKSLEGVQEYPVPADKVPPSRNLETSYKVVTLFDPHYQIIVANAFINPYKE